MSLRTVSSIPAANMTCYSMSNFVSPSLERILQQNAENKRKFQEMLG